MVYKELSTKDKDGNSWKLSLTQDPKKTNRFIFSFFFNEKEFCLSKMQNKRIADMTWELLDKIRNAASTIDSVPKDEIKADTISKQAPKPRKRPSEPKKETVKQSTLTRPKKRAKK